MPLPVDFAVLFNISPNPYMVVDRDLNFVAANEAYLSVTESRREQIIGRNLFDAFPGNPNDPDDASVRMLRSSLEKVLATRQSDVLALIPYTILKQTPDGKVPEERYWSATHTPIPDETGDVTYILQHTVDVTELQQLKRALQSAEEAREAGVVWEQVEEGVLRRARQVQETNRVLEAEQQRFRLLFQQAPGFIAILSGPEHVFLLVNDAYYQVVGHRHITGKSVRTALPELEGQGFFRLLDQVYTSAVPFVGREMSVFVQRTPDSELETVYVDFVYQPIIEEDGAVSGIFVQGHDVTEQVRIRTELRELNQHLEQRVAQRTVELTARNRELQEFAYVVTHDLQEPLRKIHTFVDLVVDEYGSAVDETGQHYLERIRASTRRISALVNDLLTYSRVSMQSGTIQRVDLNRTLNDVLADLQYSLEKTGGRVEAGYLPEIVANPVQMHQLFQNLIHNALKFARPGIPPVVRINARVTEQDPSFYQILVSDNGIGFSQQYADRIFVPFKRLHTRDKYEGNGIGLAICRRIAERHQGTIEALSYPGQGSTFIVQLPVHTQASVLLTTSEIF